MIKLLYDNERGFLFNIVIEKRGSGGRNVYLP